MQDAAAQSLSLRGEPPTLIVIETNSSAAKLFLEYAILLTKIVNRELLLLIDPSGQGDQYKAEGIEPSLRFQNALSQAACRCLRWCVIMKIEFLDVTGIKTGSMAKPVLRHFRRFHDYGIEPIRLAPLRKGIEQIETAGISDRCWWAS